MPRPEWVTVANALTVGRMLAVPVFAATFATGKMGWAFGLFFSAAATDGLDGLLARLLRQRSRLGALLDPLADKLLMTTALVLLWWTGRAPAWLVGLSLFRDVGLAVGAAVLWARRRPVPGVPSRVGKYATFTVAAFVALALLGATFELEGWALYQPVLAAVATVCVAVSLVQYLVLYGPLVFVDRT